MEELRPGIFSIGVPLPGSPLKELNAYLIKGGRRNLLVDTGFNHPLAWQALSGALDELGCTPERTDVFLTHVHVDHSGLAFKMKRPGNHVYISSGDGAYLHSLRLVTLEDREAQQQKDSIAFGIPAGRRLHMTEHPYHTFMPEALVDYTAIAPGARLGVGPYNLEVVPLYGHTPGQLGLYEREHRLLFCGDQILQRITPNIVSWDDKLDSLGQFLASLEDVRELEIDLLLPAHRGLVPDARARIDELLAHHQKRLREVMQALRGGHHTVYACARRVRWDFGGGDLDAFPPTQLWFAASEAHAHLEHLRFTGRAARTRVDGCYQYRLTERAEMT